MAGIIRKPILSIASKIFQNTVKINAVNGATSNLTVPKIATRGLSLNRSYWTISNVNKISTARCHQNHGCCSVHTKGDEALVKFLDQELEEEKRKAERTPVIDGWTTVCDGANVKLTKKFNDEKITVEFDINNSAEEADVIQDEGNDAPGELICRPPFNVDITKASGKTLKFLCQMTALETVVGEGGDLFSIDEVSLRKDGVTEENYYGISQTVIDVDMYDLLMEMLTERGIDDNFVQDISHYSTIYDQNMYVSLLEGIQKFITAK